MNIYKTYEKLEVPIREYFKTGYSVHLPGWSWERCADVCTLYYIISGSVKFSLYNKEYVCFENDIFYLSSGESAVISNMSETEKASLYYVVFQLNDDVSMERIGIERPLRDKELKLFEHFRKLYKTHLAEGAAYKIKEYSEFLKLIYELITYKFDNNEEFKFDVKLGKVVQYMKMNFYKPITVEELSNLSGYSVSHFRRIFVNSLGVSPQEYMLNYKIKKAKELLADEDGKSIEEISNILGMCNCSYFCKMFKKKTGMSPYKFKKENL